MNTQCCIFNLPVNSAIFRESVFVCIFQLLGQHILLFVITPQQNIPKLTLQNNSLIVFEIWWPRLDEDWLSCSSVWLSNWSYYFHLLQYTDCLTFMSDIWRGMNRASIQLRLPSDHLYELSPTWCSWDNSTYYNSYQTAVSEQAKVSRIFEQKIQIFFLLLQI